MRQLHKVIYLTHVITLITDEDRQQADQVIDGADRDKESALRSSASKLTARLIKNLILSGNGRVV